MKNESKILIIEDDMLLNDMTKRDRLLAEQSLFR